MDAIAWEWVKGIVQTPENLRDGLVGVQAELKNKNQAVLDRLSIVEQQIREHEGQLAQLLDLYLEGGFPKEVLTERKMRLEQMLTNLRKEQSDLAGHIRTVTLADDQLAAIEAFCARIRKGLDQADFNARWQIIELLDVGGKVAFEDGKKVLYLKCLVDPQGQQPLSPMQISPSLNTGAIEMVPSVCLRTAPSL